MKYLKLISNSNNIKISKIPVAEIELQRATQLIAYDPSFKPRTFGKPYPLD